MVAATTVPVEIEATEEIPTDDRILTMDRDRMVPWTIRRRHFSRPPVHHPWDPVVRPTKNEPEVRIFLPLPKSES